MAVLKFDGIVDLKNILKDVRKKNKNIGKTEAEIFWPVRF